MFDKFHTSPTREQRQARRRLLKGVASLGVVTLVSPFPLRVAAQSLVSSNDKIFTAISLKLTERSELLPVLCERFYHALKQQNAQFDQELEVLEKQMTQANGQSLTQALSPEAKKTAKTILSAWYTGIVGEGTQAQVITYRHALEFEAVDDVLQIRSYCPNKPGFWAAKPVEKKA